MIGKILSYIRKESKFSQDELANITKFASSTISGWETNYRQPTFENIEKIANICGYDIEFKNRKNGEIITTKNIERKEI